MITYEDRVKKMERSEMKTFNYVNTRSNSTHKGCALKTSLA